LPAATSPASLSAVLDPLLDTQTLKRASAAVHVVHMGTGEEVYALAADDGLLPASTMKLITSAVALRTLGPSYRFTTEVGYDGDLGDDGVLKGNLYVRGQGDPTMVLEKLWKLVQEVRLEGVREIRGNVVFDDTWFDSNRGIPGWDKKADIANGPAYFPSLGALSLNFNTVALFVGPGSEIGGPARVVLETPSNVVEVDNQVVTTGKGGRRWLKLERAADGLVTRFRLSGSIPQGSTVKRYYRTVADPTAYFTGAFAALCEQHALRVKGHFVRGETPADAELLLRFQSPALSTILQTVDKNSNNFMAEQVLKAVGAEVEGAPGTTEKGAAVVTKYLEELGIPSEQFKIVNGSGLSRRTVLRPTALTAVLHDLHHDSQVGPEFHAALAIGGRDGTLRNRFLEEEYVGRLRGKTGSLSGVHCLAGYVQAADEEVYAFAFLVNEIKGPLSKARRLHDDFVKVLMSLGESSEVAAAAGDREPEANE